jgi:hypothetical protein
VIKSVIDTKNFDLKIQPKLDNNNDYANDPETRVSVTGFIIYLLDLPIYSKSKSQKGVTLSNTDARYVTVSEPVKEIKFVYYLICDLHIKVNLPFVVSKDNIAAIFMSENALTSFCTWHMDTRYHFVQEFI